LIRKTMEYGRGNDRVDLSKSHDFVSCESIIIIRFLTRNQKKNVLMHKIKNARGENGEKVNLVFVYGINFSSFNCL